jgi:hypothetical protein
MLVAHEHARSVRCEGGVPLAPRAPVRREVSPFPPALGGQERRLGEGDVRREPDVDGPSPLVGQDRQGLALAVCRGARRQGLVGGLVVLEQAPRRFRERPWARGGTDLLAAGPVPLTMRLPGTRDQAGVGDERLDPGEAGAILALVEHHQGRDVANPRAGAPERQSHRLVAVGGLLERARRLGEPRIVKRADYPYRVCA